MRKDKRPSFSFYNRKDGGVNICYNRRTTFSKEKKKIINHFLFPKTNPITVGISTDFLIKVFYRKK